MLHSRLLACLCLAMGLSGFGIGRAAAANYDFLAAPERDLNRGFSSRSRDRRDRCLPIRPEGRHDRRHALLRAGRGRRAAAASDYSLVASSHEHEGGVFRVDLRSGKMSICYVLNDKVVCTPPSK